MNSVRLSIIAITLTLGLMSGPFASAEVETSDFDLGSLLENPKSCAADRMYLEKDFQRRYGELHRPLRASLSSRNQSKCLPYATAKLGTARSPSLDNLFGVLPSVQRNLITSELDRACVAAAQETFGKSGHGFVNCATGEKDKMPCRTLSNVSTVAYSINLVSRCTGANRRDLFKIFSKESGVMFNSLSWSGATGIGQMTGQTIVQVQNVDKGNTGYGHAFEKSKEISKRIKNDDLCEHLRGPNTNFTEKQANNDCATLKSKDFATLPTLLAAKNYLFIKAELDHFAKEERKLDLTNEHVNKIIRAGISYSYSALGQTKGMAAFKTSLNKVPRGKKFNEKEAFDFIAKFKTYVISIAKPSVKGEVENYFETTKESKKFGIEDLYQTVSKKVGGKECF